MAELWQAYGNWIFYAVLIFAMLWMHGGPGRRGGHGATHDHTHADSSEPRPAAESSGPSVLGNDDRTGHSHKDGKGCC